MLFDVYKAVLFINLLAPQLIYNSPLLQMIVQTAHQVTSAGQKASLNLQDFVSLGLFVY